MNCDPANPKGAEIIDVWQETVPIRFGSIDKSNRLTLDAIFRFFQEAAISHADNLRVGRDVMESTGQVWIISRMSVLVERRPKYLETVNVRSWPCGWEKLFAIRDYDIRDKDNNAAVSARSAWIIVDMQKRRPLRPQSVMDNLPLNEGLFAMSPETQPITALAERDNLKIMAERKALYSDLDYNGHVNNARYIQWIEDTLDPQILEKAEKIRLDINYVNEILEGEIIELLSAPINDDKTPVNTNADFAFAFLGRRKETNNAAFRAELRLWM